MVKNPRYQQAPSSTKLLYDSALAVHTGKLWNVFY